MTNIRITFFLSFLSFFSAIHAMDEFIPAITSTIRKRTSDRDIVIPVDNGKSNATVPPLDLNNTHLNGKSADSQKKTINNLAGLKSAASTRLTARRNGGSTSATTRNMPTRSGGSHSPSSDSPIPQPLDSLTINSPQKAPSLLPKAMEKRYSGKILLQEEKMYSESEIWEKLKTFNATLYSFGKKYHMDLDTLEIYALFAQEHDIHPTVIAEHLQGSNLSQEKSWWQKGVEQIFRSSADQERFNQYNQHLERIKRENPENFASLVFELMKNTTEQAEGMNHKSEIDTMHSTLLTQQNSDQLNQIRVQYLAMAVQFIGGLIAAAWAVYGGVGPSGNTTAT